MLVTSTYSLYSSLTLVPDYRSRAPTQLTSTYLTLRSLPQEGFRLFGRCPSPSPAPCSSLLLGSGYFNEEPSRSYY